LCYYNLKDFLSTHILEVIMSQHPTIMEYDDDGLLFPDLSLVTSDEAIEADAQLATQADMYRGEKSDEIDGPVIEMHPCPNPKQRVYSIQALLATAANEATPLWVDLWTALTNTEIAGIFGINTAVLVDRFSFGVTLGMAFSFDVIHDQIISLVLSNITLHPEAEVSMKDVQVPPTADEAAAPEVTVQPQIPFKTAVPDDQVITDLTDPPDTAGAPS
jgi:hypothetical protein